MPIVARRARTGRSRPATSPARAFVCCPCASHGWLPRALAPARPGRGTGPWSCACGGKGAAGQSGAPPSAPRRRASPVEQGATGVVARLEVERSAKAHNKGRRVFVSRARAAWWWTDGDRQARERQMVGSGPMAIAPLGLGFLLHNPSPNPNPEPGDRSTCKTSNPNPEPGDRPTCKTSCCTKSMRHAHAVAAVGSAASTSWEIARMRVRVRARVKGEG